MVWNLSKHLSNYVKSYWKNTFWDFVNKVPQDKVTPKYMSEHRLPKSGPKGTHSSSSAHIYFFLPVHSSIKRPGQNKEWKSAFLFWKADLCQPQFQETLSNIFLPSSHCRSTKMLCNDEWLRRQFIKQGTCSKVIFMKINANTVLMAYDFILEKSCNLPIIWVKES